MTEQIIYNEDLMQVMKRIPNASIDLILTDPPYNLGREYHGTYDDNRNDYETWCREWFAEMLRIRKHAIVMSVGVRNLPMWYRICPPDWQYCWFKGNNMGSGSSFTNIGVHEPFLIFGKPKKKLGVDGKYAPIVPQKDADFHDCPKPYKLIRNLVDALTDEGDMVFDGFSGSGTTAMACWKENRNFIGAEIDKTYYEKSMIRIGNAQAQTSLF